MFSAPSVSLVCVVPSTDLLHFVEEGISRSLSGAKRTWRGHRKSIVLDPSRRFAPTICCGAQQQSCRRAPWLLGRRGRLAGRAAEGGRDVVHEAVHLLSHIGVGAVAEVEVEDDLVDADRLDPLQGVNDLLGRAIK